MKYIQKNEEPIEFTEWKQKGFTKFKSLKGRLKREVKTALMIEQGYMLL